MYSFIFFFNKEQVKNLKKFLGGQEPKDDGWQVSCISINFCTWTAEGYNVSSAKKKKKCIPRELCSSNIYKFTISNITKHRAIVEPLELQINTERDVQSVNLQF